ncbi:MAG: glycosyltransferase [Candidatus Kryptoniota bacterium]
MKIVIVSTAYPLRGGIAHYVYLLYKHLSNRHQVSVVTFKRQYPKILFPGKSQEEKSGEGFIIPSVALMDSVNPLTWIKTGKYVASLLPNLVIFKYWIPFFAPLFGTVARISKKLSGCKVLFICDNVVPHEGTPVDRFLTKWAFKPVDFFIVQSKSVEKDLLALMRNPVYRNVPHPVYEIFGESISRKVARKELGFNENEKVALFFGFIRAYKGLKVLLEAMPVVLKNVNLKLLVVGEFYEDPKPYIDFIKEHGLVGNVILIDKYVPNRDVALYFSAADLVVLPYVSATQSGIVQIAYNFGIPVIVTDVGGLSEVVTNGVSGYVVEPNSPITLADAIVKFYSNDNAARLKRGAQMQKEKYSWENLVKAIESFVQDFS